MIAKKTRFGRNLAALMMNILRYTTFYILINNQKREKRNINY